jgi:branched-chain amino acid transport system substrate-binding protein
VIDQDHPITIVELHPIKIHKGGEEMKRISIFRLFLAVTLAFLFLNVDQGSAANPQMETLRIAALLPLSGGAAQWGVGILRGAELMAEKINAEGGIKVGDKRYRIELIKADDKSNYDVALAQANRLIFSEKIKFIIGPIVSGCVLAIYPVTEPNKTIVMSYCYTPKALGADKPYAFRFYASGHERIPALCGYMKKNRPNVKTIALIGPNDETGWGTSKYAKEKAEELGFEVIFEDFLQRGTTDFFPVLTKMIAKKPDAMIPHSLLPGEVALMLQQKHQLGYKGLIISPSFYELKMLVEKAGTEAVEGFIFQWPDFTGPTATPGMRELYKTYTAKYKEELYAMTVPGYATPWIIKMAIEKAGSLDTTAVAKAMENLEGEYPYGRFSMGGVKTYGSRHQISEPIFFSEIKNGALVGLGSVTPPVP